MDSRVTTMCYIINLKINYCIITRRCIFYDCEVEYHILIAGVENVSMNNNMRVREVDKNMLSFTCMVYSMELLPCLLCCHSTYVLEFLEQRSEVDLDIVDVDAVDIMCSLFHKVLCVDSFPKVFLELASK